jgi:hypothetical protein
MKIRNRFQSIAMICVFIESVMLGGCATRPPLLSVSATSLAGAKRVAIVNVARTQGLMLGARDHSSDVAMGIAPGAGGLAAGLIIAGTAANAFNNAKEFNERAPAGFALELQNQFTKSMQNEVAATGREAIIADIKLPERTDKNYAQLIYQSIREKCATCDHAFIFSGAFGYTTGDRILNPTAESNHEVARLSDSTVTGLTPFLIQRDFSNSATGHEHYNDFRNDKRDHYAFLQDLPAVAARAIAKEFR